MLAAFQVGQVLWSMLWFTLFFLWIMLVVRVFSDIIRSSDLSGLAKMVWTILIIFFPYLGVLIYLLVRGPSMAERDLSRAEAHEAAVRSYIREASGSSGASELAQLDQLRERGVINDEEFQRMKARIVT